MDTSTIVNIILCVLSFILAAISVVTVVITLRQNNKMIEESTRPVISVYTDEINAGNPFFYLIVKNFGKSPAYITKFEYDFDFKGSYYPAKKITLLFLRKFYLKYIPKCS